MELILSNSLKVILDLEEERQRHAQDTAEGDDVTYMLEKERERLTQQVIKVEARSSICLEYDFSKIILQGVNWCCSRKKKMAL